MNEETTTSVTNTTNAHPTEAETEQKNVATPQSEANQENSEQKSLAKTESGGKSEQSVQTTTEDKPAETKPADSQPTTPADPKTDPATPVKPDPTQTTKQPKKLADVVPTTLVWISGMVGSHQIDCAGPIELPFALTKPEWPYTTVAPNPNYTNQVFDYDSGTWVVTDAKSQGQQLTDLNKKVEALQEDSASHDKSADQTQKIGAQLTQTLAVFNTKLSTMEGKLDTLLNAKDGDK